METTLLSRERKITLPKGNGDLLKVALLVILILAVRLLFAEGLAVNYSSIDVKALKKWDTNCDVRNRLNWGTEVDPGNFTGVIWDSSNPKRVMKVNIQGKELSNSINLNDLPTLVEFDASNNLLQSLEVVNHQILSKLNISNNQLTILDVSLCVSLATLYCQSNKLGLLSMFNSTTLKTIDCSDNLLPELYPPAAAPVKYLYANNNSIPFSKLPLPNATHVTYTYAPQNPVFLSSTQSIGYTIDYSSEATIGAKPTTFSWFKNKTQIFGASGSTYKPVSAGSYTCKMTNAKFPGLTIETNAVTITVDPDDTNGDGYHDGDVAALNQIRSASHLLVENWLAGQHSSWTGITWDSTYPKQVHAINIPDKEITGELDISPFSSLAWIMLDNNYITSLTTTGLARLSSMSINDNLIKNLNVSGLTTLNELNCEHNLLENIQFGNNPSLKYVYCNRNHLASLDLSSLAELKEIDCSNNYLTSLDLSACSKIYLAYCNINFLTSLTIDPALKYLNCSNNQISSIDLSGASLLFLLNISNNKFYEIDLSDATDLKFFYCSRNYFAFSKMPSPDLFQDPEYDPQYACNLPIEAGLRYLIDYSSEEVIFGISSGFEWYKNNVLIEGAEGSTLNVANYGEGRYYCVITNAKFPGVRNYTSVVTITGTEQQIIGETAYNMKYNPTTIELTHSATSGLPLTYRLLSGSSCTVSGNSITITGVGTSIIIVSQEGNDEYKPVDLTLTITIQKADEIIPDINNIDITFGAEDIIIQVSTPHGFPITFFTENTDAVNIEGNIIHILKAGGAIVYASHTGNEYYNGDEEMFIIFIDKADDPILGVEDMTFTYGDPSIEIHPYTEEGFPVVITSSNPDIITVEDNRLTIVGAGTCKIILQHTGDDSYNERSLMVNVTVNHAVQTAPHFANLYRSINDPDTIITNVTDQGLPIYFSTSNGYVARVNSNVLEFVTVGETVITAFNLGNNKYLPFSESFTVTVSAQPKQTQNITNFNNMELIATSPYFPLNGATSSGFPLTYTASNNCVEINGNRATVKNSGIVEITAHQAGNETYYPVEKTITVEILKVAQTITGLNNLFKSTNSAPFNLNGTASSALDISYTSSNPEIASVSGSTVTIHAEGETTILAIQEGSWQYLPVTTEIKLTVSAANKLVDVITSPQNFELLFGVQSMRINVRSESGLPVAISSSNVHVISIEDDLLKVNNAGNATIYLSTEGNDLYAPTEKSFVVTVKKANQFIDHFDPITLKIDSEPFTLIADASSGEQVEYLLDDESVATISGNIITPVGAGTTLLIAYHEGNENYLPVVDTVEVVVLRNKLTQSVDLFDIEATYGDETVELPLKTSAGLDITYTVEDAKIASISGNILTIVEAGETFILATQGGNDLFEPFSWKGAFVVNKAQQMISGLNDLNLKTDDQPIELNGETTSGLTVLYQSSDPKIASIEGNKLRIHTVGEVIVTASQSGNSNYLPAANITFKVVVTTTTGFDRESEMRIHVYPNPSKGILNFNLQGAGTVSVYDMNGKMVFTEKFGDQFHHQTNVQQLRAGVYHFVVTQPGKRFVSSVVLN